MIHSARPIVTPVANIFFCCFVFLDLKSGDGRTDNMCENNYSYRSWLTVGRVDHWLWSSTCLNLGWLWINWTHVIRLFLSQYITKVGSFSPSKWRQSRNPTKTLNQTFIVGLFFKLKDFKLTHLSSLKSKEYIVTIKQIYYSLEKEWSGLIPVGEKKTFSVYL